MVASRREGRQWRCMMSCVSLQVVWSELESVSAREKREWDC